MIELQGIFDINYGHNLALDKLTIDNDGIPFVARTERNNGITARIAKIDNVEPSPAHSLSVACGGSVLSVFYQDEPYYSGYHLLYLVPKIELNHKEMLVYATYLRANKFRYNYGRQANRTLKCLQIPDYDEIKKIADGICTPSVPSNEPVHKRRISLNSQEWKFFNYTEIFDIKKGKRLTKADINPGNTPFIGSINSDNGCREYINQNPSHNGNTVTVNYNGSVGEAFYQPLPYWASDDVNVLVLKSDLNSYIGLFLISVIKMEKFRFNYGRKWHVKRMKTHKIKLPVDSDGAPNWNFMENYIKSLPYSASL